MISPRSVRRDDDADPDDRDESGVEDDRLRLIFTCCHPALSRDAQVALTLRTLVGLTTVRDRARVPRARADDGATARARQAQDPQRRDPVPRSARVPAARIAPAPSWPSLYLLFNEGYSATAGAELVRVGLCAEAIRLARTLVALMPDEPEAIGLLALLLLTDARRAARRRRRRRSRPARGTGPDALGRGRDRGRARAARRRVAARRARAVPGAGRDRRVSRDARRRGARPTGSRSPRSTTSCSAWCRRRSSS